MKISTLFFLILFPFLFARPATATHLTVNNKPSPGTDSIPDKQEAQNYNSSRSNKANGFKVRTGNKTDSIPDKQEAQNYNSSRSNKANGSKVRTGNKTDSIPDKQEAQNYNSSRSNKANGFKVRTGNKTDSIPDRQEAQNYNSSRSNKANGFKIRTGNKTDSIPDRQEAQNYNSSRSNKANGFKIRTGNKTDSIPDRQEAQNYNSSRSNKCCSLIIDAGGITSTGKHGGNGISFSVGYRMPITGIFGLEAAVGYAVWQFEYEGSPRLPETYVSNMKENMGKHSWKTAIFNIGPDIQLGRKRLTATIYSKAGVSFINIPEQFAGAANKDGKVTNETGIAKFSGNKTSFTFQAGIRVNYAVSRTVDVYLHPYFLSTAKNIPYTEKDISSLQLNDSGSSSDSATPSEGTSDIKKFMSLPYEMNKDKIQLAGLSIGINIHLQCK